ncbi:CDP-glycerol glycerophosphotransferase family protein [Ekhidna sp.]
MISKRIADYTPQEILSVVSRYSLLINKLGFDSRLFYFNRSRLFLSLTADKIANQKRSKFTLLLFFITSLIRLIKGIFSSKRIPNVLIVDTREYYGKTLKKKGFVYDNILLTYLYDYIDWSEIGLLDRFNLPFDDNQFPSQWYKHIRNISTRPRLYEEIILFKYLILHPFSWIKTKKRLTKEFGIIKDRSFDSDTLNTIHRNFLKYQKSTLFFAWKEEAYLWYFESSGIKKILILDEYSPNQRSILNASAACGIDCIALQHGGIHELHPGYVYGPEERKLNLFPNQFLTWGSSFSEFLKDNNWPASISEVGHLRTDIIADLKGATKSKSKRVMFASQPHKDESYTEHTAKMVFRAFADQNDNLEMFVRTHPLEKNVEKYQKWADEVSYKDLSIEAEEDLYVQLANTDIVITAFSTVGQEAIYFQIPLITVDYLNRDIASYVKEGIASNVTNSEDLMEAIKEELAGSKSYKKEYQKYIDKYAHVIDGKVHDRILKFLLSE